MSPKEARFSKTNVLTAAMDLVREKGWAALTARGIAGRLGASVAPIYSVFGSMESLEREVLNEARRLLNVQMAVSYTEGAFLNVGVGMVVFAREEAHLFSALFHTRHHHPDIVDAIYEQILAGMKADALLRQLSDASLERLLHNLQLYTLGLAAAIVYGEREDSSTENIIRLLNNAGNMMIHGELTGIADADSPENEAVWRRLLDEKHLTLPGSHGPEPVLASKDKEKP